MSITKLLGGYFKGITPPDVSSEARVANDKSLGVEI